MSHRVAKCKDHFRGPESQAWLPSLEYVGCECGPTRQKGTDHKGDGFQANKHCFFACEFFPSFQKVDLTKGNEVSKKGETTVNQRHLASVFWPRIPTKLHPSPLSARSCSVPALPSLHYDTWLLPCMCIYPCLTSWCSKAKVGFFLIALLSYNRHNIARILSVRFGKLYICVRVYVHKTTTTINMVNILTTSQGFPMSLCYPTLFPASLFSGLHWSALLLSISLHFLELYINRMIQYVILLTVFFDSA